MFVFDEQQIWKFFQIFSHPKMFVYNFWVRFFKFNLGFWLQIIHMKSFDIGNLERNGLIKYFGHVFEIIESFQPHNVCLHWYK